MSDIPRLRGRVGKGYDGKFYFEISMWNFAATQQVGEPMGPFGPWDTEGKAKAEMRRAIEIGVKAIAPDANGFVDMKNGGQFRKFISEEN